MPALSRIGIVAIAIATFQIAIVIYPTKKGAKMKPVNLAMLYLRCACANRVTLVGWIVTCVGIGVPTFTKQWSSPTTQAVFLTLEILGLCCLAAAGLGLGTLRGYLHVLKKLQNSNSAVDPMESVASMYCYRVGGMLAMEDHCASQQPKRALT
jgi:nucleoside recognition membrane protein YjiH